MTQNNFKVKHGLEVPAIDSIYLSDITTPAIRPTLNLDFTKGFDPRITFTRASTATYYDGKTFALGNENLLTYSNDFTNSVWGKTDASATANTVIGPDGVTQNGSTLTEGSLNSTHKLTQTAGKLGIQTLSCYAKAGTRIWFRLTLGDSTDSINVWFNLSDQTTYTTVNGTGVLSSATMVDAGNGWWRCVLIGTPSTDVQTAKQAIIAPADSAGAGIYQGTDSYLYIYGAQLESRDFVTPYVETTSTPVSKSFMKLVTAPVNVPRIEYDPITQECKGLLIEEQRSNSLTQSLNFSDVSWGKTGTTATLSGIGPDGTLSAYAISSSTASINHAIYKTFSFTSATYSFSVYLKSYNYRYAMVWMYSGSGTVKGILVDLNTGSFVSDADSSNLVSSYTIKDCGNGWYRISITATTSLTQFGASPSPTSTPTLTATKIPTFTGDGISGFYIWGAQLEVGAYPTSYIPTTNSQATRSGDFANMTGSNFTSWYNSNEGTLISETAEIVGSTGETVWQFGTGGSDRMWMQRNTTTGGRIQVNVATVGQYYFNNMNPSGKVAFAYKTNDFAAIDGDRVLYTDIEGTIPAVSAFYIGAYSTNNYQLGTTIKRLVYYPKRLSNESIKSLSTK